MSACPSSSAHRAVAYVRRSTDRQEQSLDDQRRAIETYAEREGVEIVAWYQDDAISGASVDARAGFKKMLVDASGPDRSWRKVLVYDVSRFSRGDLDEAGYLRHQFRLAGVDVVYVAENLTGGEADDLVVGVKQWMAQKYVKDLSKVTIRGQLTHGAAGAWNGGTPPYGYDLLYVDSAGRPYQRVRWLESGDKEVYDTAGKLTRIVPRGERLVSSKQDHAVLVPSTPERVAIIKRLFHECVELGHGHRTIAGGLNVDGIPSPRDGNWSANTKSRWSMATVRAMLRNPAYRGDTVWNRRTFAKFHKVRGGVAEPRSRTEASKPRHNDEADWIVVPGTHEPLVPPTMFERAQELMKSRAVQVGAKNVRAGSALRSPYLLSGLVACGRCGQNYQGRVVNSTKRRLDGSKIQTHYYCCGAWVMKGNAACQKLMIKKDPLEEILLGVIEDRVQALVAGEGEVLLRQMIDEEIAAQGADPRREAARIRARVAELDQKASVLLDAVTPETRDFVNAKLRDLATEKRGHAARLEELETLAPNALDADAVLKAGLELIGDLPRLLQHGTLEERKQFVRAFVTGVTVLPDAAEIEVQIRKFPVLGTGNSACQMVAGAGFEPATFGL